MVQKQTTVTRSNWDDLRVALAVARAGSLRAAARTLGVSHSTVLRRLAELESAAGVRLFERAHECYELTGAGQDLCETAREIEDDVLALERRVAGQDLRLAGPIRVTLPDALLPALLPTFREFGERYPDIELTLTVAAEYLDLAAREADVALRIAAEPPPELVGRRVVDVTCGVYGSKRYLDACAPSALRHLERLTWVGWPPASAMGFARWMREHVPRARVALRVESSWALRDAVDADLGVAILPCVLGDARQDWRRVRSLPDVTAPLWILSHKDLRATARVRALRDTVAAAVLAQQALFLGRAT